MKKKLILIFLVSFIFNTVIFASDSSTTVTELLETTAGMPAFNTNTKLFDIPISSGITQFANTLENLTGIVSVLIFVFAFLMIIFNSFKLWAGTLELKKAFVDIVYKCVICMVICVCYRPITDVTIKFANEIGASCSGGYQKIDHIYTEAYKTLKANIEKGLKEIKETLKNNAFTIGEGENQKKYITDNTIDDLQSYGLTKEEALDWAKQEGLSLAHEHFVIDTNGRGERLVQKSDGWVDEDGKLIEDKFHFSTFSSAANLTKNDKKTKKKYDEKIQLQYVSKLKGLADVVSEEEIISESETDEQIKNSKETVKKIIYSPWLKDKNNKNTFFLSPNSIIKTVLVMGDAVANGSTYQIDTDTSNIEEVDLNPKGIWTPSGILKALLYIIYKFGMLLSVIIVMTEYELTILEFYIVRAFALFLVPLLFLDATKSFAQNLIRLLLTYFFKIMLTVMCCFFSLGLYLDTLIVTFNNLDLTATITVGMYISTMIMGLLLTTKAPGFVNSLISGQPSMGVGDIARLGHSASHMMHTAQHGIKSAEHGLQTAGKVGQGMARGAASGLATVNGAFDAADRVKSAAELERQSGHSSAKDHQINSAAAGAFWSTIGNAMKQSAGDKAYKAAFGSERPHLDELGNNNGKLKIGQKFMDKESGKERIANFADVQNSMKNMSSNPEQKAKDKLSKYDREQDSDKGIENALERKIELPEDNGY